MTFLGKHKGKENRKKLYENWKKGDGLFGAKMKVLLEEIGSSLEELQPASDEFMKQPKVQKAIKEGKKKVDATKKKVRKATKTAVRAGKKRAAAKLREVSGLKKKLARRASKKK